ncbi:MAG: OmpH family outer membrane protein [bacterium]
MRKLILIGILGVMPIWGINISFIDAQKAFDSHPDTAKAREILQKEIEKENLEIKIKEKEILALQDELEKPISEEAKRRKEATIQAKMEEYQMYKQEATENLAKKRKELEDSINVKIKGIISQIAKEKKIDLVLDKDSIIYGEDSLDITNEVIKRIAEKKSEEKENP